MKNVIINKLVKYVFTEGQLRARWNKLGDDLPFDSLTPSQLMALAKRMLNEASHHELEQNLIGYGWRTENDITGKMVDDDDSTPGMHIELIDTDLNEPHPNQVIIDRMVKLSCETCHFEFYVEELEGHLNELNCPKDGGPVTIVNNKISHIFKEN